MTELISKSDQRFLLKKLWCHGQFLSPIIGLLIYVFTFKMLDGFSFFYCIISFPLYFIWSYFSYKSMNGKYPDPDLLGKAGFFLELYFIGIIIISMKFAKDSTLALLVLIFSILQICETFAFLVMVKALDKSLIDSRQDDLIEEEGLFQLST
jgi:hypothetical protein